MADEQALTPQPTVLWLTSRSTFERGAQYCAFARYVETHAGPYGYGMQRKAQSLPLVTGTYVHHGLALILQWLIDAAKATGIQPIEAPDEVIRWAVGESITKYTTVVEKRGILTLTQDNPETYARLTLLIQEQCFLIEGLTWAWCLGRLPALLQEYDLVSVETEETYVTDCGCGLGDGIGEISDHEARGCGGIGILSRPDAVGRRKSDGQYGYIEFKTASVAKRRWNESWERKIQFLLGILGAERRLGVEITHYNVEGLIKGQRKRDNWKDETGPTIQQSCVCYAYFTPGAPPTSGPEWRPGYNYIDREGIEFTAGKREGYKKTALWEPPADLAWPGKPEESSIVEYWCKVLASEYPHHLAKNYSFIGPIPKQRHQMEQGLRAITAEERLWQDRCWKIYEFAQKTGKAWGDPEFMEFVETVVPRSYNCDPYGPDHPCQHHPICHPVTDEWRNPIEGGLYVYRVPHHVAELQQMLARGLKPEEGLAEEIEEVEVGD